jgi:hypothetical protein
MRRFTRGVSGIEMVLAALIGGMLAALVTAAMDR